MKHRSPTQPFCRTCGKPIAKRTVTKWVKPEPSDFDAEGTLVGVFRTKAEVQATTNLRVLSVAKRANGTIYRFGAWDGESYEDQFFCTIRCAEALGRMMAREGHCTKAYNAAVAKAAEVKAAEPSSEEIIKRAAVKYGDALRRLADS